MVEETALGAAIEEKRVGKMWQGSESTMRWCKASYIGGEEKIK